MNQNPIPESFCINISDFPNTPFIGCMVDQNGIYTGVEYMNYKEFQVFPPDKIVDSIKKLSPLDAEKLFNAFTKGSEDVEDVIHTVTGKTFTQQSLRTSILTNITGLKKPNSAHFIGNVLTSLILLFSGAGVGVILDEENFFYNVGYQIPIVQSGRSFSFPLKSERGILDPSDPLFLSELSKLQLGDASSFYSYILKCLIRSDVSNLSKLSNSGLLALDFITVYSAELIRFAMTGFVSNPWCVDIAQVLFLNAYSAFSGLVAKSKKLVKGDASVYYARGPHGSGIGDTRSSFTWLSTKITEYLNKEHVSLIKELENITQIDQEDMNNNLLKCDIIRRFSHFLSIAKYKNNIKKNQDQLFNCISKLLETIQNEQKQITDMIGFTD